MNGRWRWSRISWRDLQWPLLFILGLIGFVLGYLGFMNYIQAARRPPHSMLDLFYLTIQLVSLESGAVYGPVNWQLEVARLLLPTVAAFTLVKAFAMLFREQTQRVRLWFVRDHIVIAGLSRKGLRLVDQFRRADRTVVLIEQDEDHHLAEVCLERGAILLFGDATDTGLLYRAGVDRAGYLISVCGDDGVNAEVAVRAQELCRDRTRGVLTCIIHIVDTYLYDLLREREFEMEQIPAFRLSLFNIFDRGGQVLLHEYLAEWTDSPHILVIGLGSLGSSLIVHAARKWPGADLRITIIDREAHRKVDLLRVRYPHLEEVCRLIPRQMDIHSSEFQRADFLDERPLTLDASHILGPSSGGDNSLKAKTSPINIVYVCLDNDSLGLHAGLVLLKRLPATPIVVRMAEEAGLATLLYDEPDSQGVFANLYAFGLLDRTCTPDQVIGGTNEILARALHETYIRHQREMGHTPEKNPSMRPWAELPEHLKESNRRQVDQLRSQLRAVGYGIEPLTKWDAASVELGPDEIETIARLEHARWRKDQSEAGWRYAPGPKDPIQKISPALVPWEELPEAEKAKNYHAARQLPARLAEAGFQIYRRPAAD